VIIDGLKLEPGRAMGKADKTDLSHEAVWGITAHDGTPVVIITGPVTKKFAVNLLYQVRGLRPLRNPLAAEARRRVLRWPSRRWIWSLTPRWATPPRCSPSSRCSR